MTKPMIDIIREIRRRSSDDVKDSIKLANPNIIDELIVLYHNSNDPIVIALVKELCVLAGPPWSLMLADKKTPRRAPKKFVSKVNKQGQVSIEPINDENSDMDEKQERSFFDNYKKYLGS